MALGALLLMLTQLPALTITSAFVMGLIGSYTVVIVPAALADHHGSKRAIELTESNVAASLSTVLVPLLIGFGEASGLGWRVGLVAGIVWLGLLAVFFRGTAVPAGEPRRDAEVKRPLPRRFWAYWLVIMLGVALEWSIVFWGADFLEKSVGLEKVTSATLMSIFFLAMVIGRVIGSRLTRTIESSRLLVYAIAVVGVGFPLFWLSPLPVLNVLGLFLAGLGIANLFPLTLAVATSIDPSQANAASGRISIASGIAILVVPQILGSFADQVGIFNAFGVAAVLLIAAALIVFAERRFKAVQAAQSR
ncbi:MAG: MFS transporter [Chloroflexota bacterium]